MLMNHIYTQQLVTFMPAKTNYYSNNPLVPTHGTLRCPPGSGKGTISGKILRDFHFAHISTGDLLRDEIQAGSEIGQTAKT